MEQQKASANPMNKILKLLPRASSVSFHNPTIYSPAKDKRSSEKSHKSNLGMITIIPSDSRRKSKSDLYCPLVYEPSSPRVSCMGTVKCKQYRKKLAGAARATIKPPPTVSKPTNKFSRTSSFTPVRIYNNEDDQEKVAKVDPLAVECKKKSGIRSLIRGGAGRSGRKSDASSNNSTAALNLANAPCLSTMKRFSSGRDAFSNFDWTITQVTPLDSDHRNHFTDDEREENLEPSSAPVMVRNKGVCDNFIRVGAVKLEPKKEINLWKRRTMAQPKPLQLTVA